MAKSSLQVWVFRHSSFSGPERKFVLCFVGSYMCLGSVVSKKVEGARINPIFENGSFAVLTVPWRAPLFLTANTRTTRL